VRRVSGTHRLSPRQHQVLRLLADGHRAAAIAERFVVSLSTVRTQIRAILTKPEVSCQLSAPTGTSLSPSLRRGP
jgi:DNA-binding NarL/FixJ family response regulator